MHIRRLLYPDGELRKSSDWNGVHLIDKIVTGGQTGVDRGVLDAALKVGFACGGWCPEGRRAEDGAIPKIYPVRSLAGAGYSGRTLRNVIDSDGTVVLHFGALTGGSHLTAACCRKEKKPFLLVDGDQHTREQTAKMIAAFADEHCISTLNIAGPRASQVPRAYLYAFDVVTRLVLDYQRTSSAPQAGVR